MTSAREKKALEACLKGKEPEVIQVSDKVIYPNDKNISIESLQPADVNMKPQPASKTPSLILPQFHTQNFVSLSTAVGRNRISITFYENGYM